MILLMNLKFRIYFKLKCLFSRKERFLMVKTYKKILFDLDNTLVDDDENRKYALAVVNKKIIKKRMMKE